MVFQPNTGQQLVIQNVPYRISGHPSAPGMPYGQEGRTAVVYQLEGPPGKRALKVFKPRFRVPGLVSLSRRLAPFAELTGLRVCLRTVLTPQGDAELLAEHPDLIYAVSMPWIEGPSWTEVLLNKQAFSQEQSLSAARGLGNVLLGMEQENLAHCDLSGSNVLLPVLANAAGIGSGYGPGLQSPVELVDVEQMYAPGMKQPDYVPAGSSGYAHNSAHEGLWSPEADRFAGALLLAEMLGWCDERVRDAAWGESYFDPEEMQKESPRYRVLLAVLTERWGDGVASAFGRAWLSGSPVECPTFGEWVMLLPLGGAGMQTQQTRSPQPDKQAPPVPAGGNPAVAEPSGAANPAMRANAGDSEARARIDELVQRGGRLEAAGDIAGALGTYSQARALAPSGSTLGSELDLVIGRLQNARVQGPYAPNSPMGQPATIPVTPPGAPWQQPSWNNPQYPPQAAQNPGYNYIPPAYPPQPVQVAAPAKKGSALPVILVVLLVLVLACVGGTYLVITRTVGAISSGIGSLAASVEATETASADEAATGGHADPQATPVEQVLSLDTPRAFKYANLKFAVVDGLITNRLPGDTPRYRSDAANLHLKLAVTNDTVDSVGVSGASMKLKLGGAPIHQEPVDLRLDGQSSDEIELNFEVPLTTSWEGAQLTLQEEDRELAALPLTGPTAASAYPVALQANGEASVSQPRLTFKIEDASLDLDAFGERARVGKQFLLLKVLVSSHEDVYDAYVGPESFRIILDGKPIGPDQLSPAADAVKAATEQEFKMAFTLPTGPGSAELQVGEVGKETAKIPLQLQTPKP